MSRVNSRMSPRQPSLSGYLLAKKHEVVVS